MSAAPLPRPGTEIEAGPIPTGSGPDRADLQVDEGWQLLEGLRRRLDDHTTQNRKTQQQVTQLTESIAALVADQRQRTRRINLNSFVAYLVFTVLLGVGFYLLYNSRANELVEARDHAIKERDAASARAADLSTRAAARELADARAWEVFQLLEAGKRSEATAKLATLHDLKLSRTERATLAARAHETQVMEVDNAIKAATASFKAGRHGEAIAPLEAALVGEPNGSRRATMRYFLGIAYAKTGALDKAITYLQAALDAAVEHDDARFQLASALDRAGHYAKARTEYDKFATAFPQSQFAVYAMRRSAALAKLPPTAPGAKPDSAAVPKPAAGSAAPLAPKTPPAPATQLFAPKPGTSITQPAAPKPNPAAPATQRALPKPNPTAAPPPTKPAVVAPKQIAPPAGPQPVQPKPEPAPAKPDAPTTPAP